MTETQPLHKTAAAVEAEYPDLSPEEIAEIILTQIDDLRTAFLELVVPLVEHMRRNRYRQTVERPMVRRTGRYRTTFRRDEGDHADASARAEQVEEEINEQVRRDGPAAVLRDLSEQIITRFTDNVRAEVRLELTAQRMLTPISLYDGKVYRFGELTWEQHLTRADWLSRNAAGIGKTTAIHLEAARLLQETGAHCLSELVPPEEAA